MKSSVILLLFVVCSVACGNKWKVLGKAPKEAVSTILAIHSGDAPTQITLEGTLIEKCPQAGCWFRIDDGTGVLKVDTKAAGFVVSTLPLKTKVKVAGKIVSSGAEPEMEATGLVY